MPVVVECAWGWCVCVWEPGEWGCEAEMRVLCCVSCCVVCCVGGTRMETVKDGEEKEGKHSHR